MRIHEDEKLDVHAAILGKNINENQFKILSPKIDVFVYQNPQTPPLAKNIDYMNADPSTLTVVEMDDALWYLDYRQESYAMLGHREVKLDGKYLYKDGMDGFDLKANKTRLSVFNHCLKAADLITVTTPELAKIVRENVKNMGKSDPQVAVLPNCLDLSAWNPVEIKKDEIRLGWVGGFAHRHDIQTILPALKKVLKKHPNVKVVIAGNSWGEVEEALGDRLILDKPWTTISAHPYRMKTLGIDIGLAPLVDNTFNRGKSELKYLEYSALGIPTVASDIPPYSPVIEDGKTGYLAKTEAQWVKRLCQLVEDEELRKKIGSAARAWVERERDADKTYTLWLDAYAEALKKKRGKLEV